MTVCSLRNDNLLSRCVRDGWPTANIVLKVHTLLFLFFFFFLRFMWWKAEKADLALFLRPDLEKEKNKEQIWPGAVRPKIIILRAVIQSWNFADFDLYIGGETSKLRNLGFRQCKTIIMPLIPISYSSVSCCRRCFAVLSDVPSASAVSCWLLLLRSPEDFHFANYRFPFRFVPFRFAPFRFANYSKPKKHHYTRTSSAWEIKHNLI